MEELTYQFHKEDWMAFNLHHIANSPAHHKNRSKAIRSVPVMLVGLTLFYGISKGEWLIPFFVSLIVGTFWIMWYPGFRDKKVIRGIESFIDERGNKSFLGQHKVQVSEGGVTLQTENSEEYVEWAKIEKLETTDDYVFLYNSALTGIMIPMLAIPNLSQFEDMIEESIKNA